MRLSIIHHRLSHFDSKNRRTLKSKNNVMPSMHIPRNSKEKQIPCDFCSSVFTRNSSLKRHITSVNEGKKRTEVIPKYQDANWDSSDYSRIDLKDDTLNIESVHAEKKTFKCPMCISSFTQKGFLNRH